jgi:hypothetical protein
MVTNSRSRRRTQNRNATIQWLALIVAAALALLAAFVVFGDDSGTGGHSGHPATFQTA